MFTTYRSAEILLDGLDQLQPSQVWRCIEQELIYPWYYVQIGRWGRSATSSSMLMIHHAHELRELVDRQSPLIWLEQVHFVCPPHMNGESVWTMEPLKMVSVLTFPDIAAYDLQIDVTSGRTYFMHNWSQDNSGIVTQILYDAVRDLKPR